MRMAGGVLQCFRAGRTMSDLLLLNGLWRTATTYLWHKVRSLPQWSCYYEPLHEGLAAYTPSIADLWRRYATWTILRHPALESGYFDEFPLRASGPAYPGITPTLPMSGSCWMRPRNTHC